MLLDLLFFHGILCLLHLKSVPDRMFWTLFWTAFRHERRRDPLCINICRPLFGCSIYISYSFSIAAINSSKRLSVETGVP